MFACFIAYMQWMPQFHFWCYTCWPPGGQHNSPAVWATYLRMSTSISGTRTLNFTYRSFWLSKFLLNPPHPWNPEADKPWWQQSHCHTWCSSRLSRQLCRRLSSDTVVYTHQCPDRVLQTEQLSPCKDRKRSVMFASFWDKLVQDIIRVLVYLD